MSAMPPHRSFDLQEFATLLARRKWLLIVPWVVAVTAGTAAAFLLPPIYFSSVTMLLERPRELSGPLGGMVGTGNPAEQQAEVMREQVQSSLFLKSVITATGLRTDPETRAWALKQTRRFPGMTEDEAVESFLIDYLRGAAAIRRTRGDVFQVTVGDYRPKRAQRFAEGIANQFVISSKAAQLEAVRATQEFSVEQQQIYKRKLEESEARLEAARRASVASTIVGTAVNAQNLVRARSLVDQADLEVEEQRSRVAQMRAQLEGRAQPNDPEAISSAESNTLATQLSGLERQLASTMLTAGELVGDPGGNIRLAISRKVGELEAALSRNAALALPGLPVDTRDLIVRFRLAQADLEAKQARRSFLGNQVSLFEQQTISGPDRDMGITRLEQEVENDRALYNSFLTQSASGQIAEAFENAKLSGRFTILEPANLPYEPGKPDRPMLILLSLLAGAVLGVGTVILVEQQDQSMRDVQEVESLLGLPVLGTVPRGEGLRRPSRRNRSGVPAKAESEAGLLQKLEVESPLALEFRRIAFSLSKSAGRELPHTLLLTSATRGEGKTTTTAGLAVTLARELGQRILVVDFDLRSPALHRALGVPGSNWGLAQMLQQRQFDTRFVRTTVLETLDFIPAGRSERPVSELIDDAGVAWFVKEARERYPFVILDSAPCLAVPDSLILGRAVEGVVFVIKAGATVRKAAEYGVKVQREARDNIIGVLLNDLGDVLPHYYGYRSQYYGYASSEASGARSE
jgi:capsular exopolysaccharide synthesis family protein